PVMATLSPFATAVWMVASTALTASVADFLSPSRPEIASIRSRLFMVHSCASPTGRVGSDTRSRPLTCPKVSDPAPLHNTHGHIDRRSGEYHTPQQPTCIHTGSKLRLRATVRSHPRSEAGPGSPVTPGGERGRRVS